MPLNDSMPSAQTPVLGEDRKMTKEWYKFFDVLFTKVNGLQYTDIPDPNFAVLADAEAYCQQLVDAFRASGLGD